MRLLFLLCSVLFALSTFRVEAQVMDGNTSIGAVSVFVQPNMRQDVSTTIKRDQVGNASVSGTSVGNRRQFGYRMYAWGVISERPGEAAYFRLDPQSLYFLGSCAIAECRDDVTTTRDRNGRVEEVEDESWSVVDLLHLEFGVMVAEFPLAGAVGLGLQAGSPFFDGPIIATAKWPWLVEAGPQVSHAFSLDGVPVSALSTLGYSWGFDINGGGFGSSALRFRTDIALNTGIELMGSELGVGASYFWDNRTLSGADIEADGTFSGWSYGLVLR